VGADVLPRYETIPLPIEPISVQLDNRTAWNNARSIQRADFFTLGYAGRTIDEVIMALEAVGVATVVDVRYSAVSMYKPDFNKGKLRTHLEEAGIGYLHRPDLGIPRDIRSRVIGKQDRTELWEWYDRFVVADFVGENLHHFFNFADHPIALMCLETDPTACHRHRLVLALERFGLKAFDL
jgi:uncharacterized protein (DUF488 family)